jgi:hypothetical protein
LAFKAFFARWLTDHLIQSARPVSELPAGTTFVSVSEAAAVLPLELNFTSLISALCGQGEAGGNNH